MQSGRLAAAVVEPEVPDELPLPLRPAEPELPPEPEEPDEPEPAVPDEEPPAIEPELPLPVELEPLEPEPVEPDPVDPVPDEPVFEAVFKRGCPVVLSLQCVAADTFELPLADGEEEEEEDWAAAPITLAPTTAAESISVFNIRSTPWIAPPDPRTIAF